MNTNFKLSASENDRIYREVIEPAYFSRSTATTAPTAIIVGGQPGAGKSRLIARSIRELDKNVVAVNTDDLRAFHPKFEEIASIDDKLSAERTHYDASKWNQKLFTQAVATKRNIVLEGVLKDSKKLTTNIKLLKANGYKVIVRFLAIHERFSLFGIYKRYEGEKVYGNHGRYVPAEYHQQCYQSLLNTAVALESQNLGDKIEIVSRDGACLFSNKLKNNRWESTLDIEQAILQIRNEKPTKEQCLEYEQSWDELLEDMNTRKASEAELQNIKALATRLVNECWEASALEEVELERP